MSVRRPFALLMSLGLALSVSAAAANASESALGADGTVYRLVGDRYENLFEGESEAPADSAVLALEISTADGGFERLLVPETESRGAELGPQLVYEQSSDTLFVLWEGIFNDLHPLLYLASFRRGAWDDVLEISGNPFARKGHPQLRVTRDRVRGADVGAEENVRTTLHIVWWEETAAGSRKRYAPITIEGQSQRTWHPTWDLSSFVAEIDNPPLFDNTELIRLAAGPKHNSVTMGFLTTAGDRVVTLESEVVPRALADLGDSIRVQFINDGLRVGSMEELAALIETFILASGEGFHAATLSFLAERVGTAIRAERMPLQPAGFDELADTIRVQFINDGVRIATNGLTEDDAFDLIEIERLDAPGTFHVLKVTTLSERPVPEMLGESADLFLSVDGRHAILAWQGDGEARYVESIDDGWGPVRSLQLREGFSFDDARQMLDELARSR